MNKNIFNSMTIEQQVNYFNENLHIGKTITCICDEIKISYNTIRDRFKKNLFVFNKRIKQYECVESIFRYDDEQLEKTLEKIILKLFNNGASEINMENDFKCKLKGKVINRSFRIYDTILKDFTNFCDNSNYNQYDILSQFIQDGIEKYNNIAM